MEVVLEDDATPLVMIIGTTLRRATADPALARRAEGLKGVFAVKSANDLQAVTMRFAGGRVALSRGVAPDANVVATVDLDNMSGPDAAKPKVRGALRHPKFALGVSKLLDAPLQPWPELARAFWAFAGAYPGMPESLRIVGLDDGTTVDLGAGAPVYEIHGDAAALGSIFGGGSVFGQDLLDGKVYAIGSMKHASILTGRSIEWTLRGAS
jgi:hypothetical protein